MFESGDENAVSFSQPLVGVALVYTGKTKSTEIKALAAVYCSTPV